MSSQFILEEYKLSNYTTSELLRMSEATDNSLAVSLYNSVIEDHENSDDDIQDKVDIVLGTVEDTVQHILSNPTWNKHGSQSKGYYWVLDQFDADSHVEQHSVKIEACENKRYMVTIEYGECGETMHEQRMGGLGRAKEYALKWALTYALRNELRL